MGWRRGEAGGVDREEEREERPEEVRGEAVEGEDEGVVGGVGMVSLGLGRSEVSVVVVVDELEVERLGLRVKGDEGFGFGAAALPLGDGSMAENHTREQISEKKTHGLVKITVMLERI